MLILHEFKHVLISEFFINLINFVRLFSVNLFISLKSLIELSSLSLIGRFVYKKNSLVSFVFVIGDKFYYLKNS